MARGRRTAAAASGVPAPPDPLLELDRTIEEIESATDQRLARELSGLLAQEIDPLALSCPSAGGLSGDIDLSALDLRWAAIFAARIRPERREVDPTQLLAQAIEHQQRHLERMKQMALTPRTREGVAYWRTHRLKSTDTDAHARGVGQAEAYLAEMTDLTSEDLEREGKRTRAEDHTRRKLCRDEVNGLLRRFFLVDDDATAMSIARSWLERSGDQDALARISDFDEVQLQAAGRLVRATQHIDNESDTLILLAPGNFTNQVTARLGERAFGDDPRALLRGRNETLPGAVAYERQLTARNSLREIQLAAWAYLREPERFGGRSLGLGFFDTDQKTLRCVIPAGPDGISEFIAHTRRTDTPARLNIVDQPRGAKGFNHELYLTATSTLRIRGRDVTVEAVLPLGQHRGHPGSETRNRFVRSRLVELLGSDTLADATPIESGSSLRGGLYAERPQHWGGRPAPADVVLGDRHCEHPRAAWLEAGATNRAIPAARRLACPDCLRTRIALEPLHRATEGQSDEAIGDRAKYLRAEAYFSILRGEPVAWSLEELRRRDGLASMNPADYASDVPKERSPRLDIESALSGRRR